MRPAATAARALLLGIGLIVGLAACGGPRDLYPSRYAVPPDPPPVPERKPPTPPGFAAAAQAGSDATAAGGEIVRVPLTTAAAGTPAIAPDSSYRVQLGDTLYAVSRRSNVPIRAIIDANGLQPPYDLQEGQTLRIPRPRVHRVSAGDTVYGISRRYGVEMSELVRLNGIPPPYAIATGQRLVIPGPGGSQPAAAGQGGTLAQSGSAAAPVQSTASAGREARPRSAASGSLAAPTASKPAPEPVAAAPKPAAQDAGRQDRLAAIPKPPPRQSERFLWPVEGKVVARYGPRKGGQHNDGINILAPRGAPVRAAENGVVVYAGEELKGFGRLLLVKHSGGWVTAYAHNQDLLVGRGQTVKRGQTIARVGSSGNVASPQLHFEIRKGTRALDPARLLAPRSASISG